MDLPGNSPDLNPIENLWSRLKRLVSPKRPANRECLIAAIIECWFHVITNEHLHALVESMPRRCQAVIDARGYPTKYWCGFDWNNTTFTCKFLCCIFGFAYSSVNTLNVVMP